MSHFLTFRPEVLEEMESATAFYEEKSLGLGDLFFEELETTFTIILQSPFAFPQKQDDYRQAVINRFPYTIWYRVNNFEVVVVAVWHTSRNPDELLRRF
jgi:plasmid stabilization system protein ParE